MAARAGLRSAVALAALALLGEATGACTSTEYVIPPAQASQMDDPDWVIKHEPKTQEPPVAADGAAPQAPEPAPATPSAVESKP